MFDVQIAINPLQCIKILWSVHSPPGREFIFEVPSKGVKQYDQIYGKCHESAHSIKKALFKTVNSMHIDTIHTICCGSKKYDYILASPSFCTHKTNAYGIIVLIYCYI